MATEISLESIKRKMNIHFGLGIVFEVDFKFEDDTVVGTIMVPVPPENVTDGELVTKTREHLHGVFLRLAEEVIRPQKALGTEADVQTSPPTMDETGPDPAELAAERRREEIAAAKLLIAVSLYANGTVPGAELLPTARQDSEGLADAARLTAEASSVVETSMPDGFGGTKRSLNPHVGRWLREGDHYNRSDVLGRIKNAVSALGTESARPQACQELWSVLKDRAR